jgi:hypothetical protein
MDFIKKRVRQFQEKKLGEIMDKIQFHKYMKNQLERKIIRMADTETDKIREEILFNKKMIEVWQRNEEKLRKQMSEMEN